MKPLPNLTLRRYLLPKSYPRRPTHVYQSFLRYGSSQSPPNPPEFSNGTGASSNDISDSSNGQNADLEDSQVSLTSESHLVEEQGFVGDEEGFDGETDFGEDLYPNLRTPVPLFDAGQSEVFQGKLSKRMARITVRNANPIADLVDDESRYVPEEKSADDPMNFLPIPASKLRGLHRYPLITRRVTQQTGKGKIHRMYLLVVVGNGNGLVGYGEGKHDDFGKAQDKAVIEAIRNMDYVERFESRTIWTNMDSKFGATRILMRPRPVGFGLHCNPHIHQVLKAAGVKDVSAKVWGSRNPINVIKATCRMIQAGNAPLGMGNGLGGKGKRLDSGSGMRSREAIERERGRKLVEGYA